MELPNIHPSQSVEPLAEKPLLRISTAGSVDDGKSTLIGRLIVDSKGLFDDQLANLRKRAQQRGKSDGPIDLAALTDGLKSEQEQGITIDVAYRYFSTPVRKYIIADTPGHAQYTRNMATGSSTADCALVLVDAERGVTEQTHRHLYIAVLLGIRHIVIVVNKMDLVDHSRLVFNALKRKLLDSCRRLKMSTPTFIPISALAGDNVCFASQKMPWFNGPSLLTYLENLQVGDVGHRPGAGARLPVQYVLRPHRNFRGFAGQLSGHSLTKGDEVIIWTSGQRSRIEEIFVGARAVETAFPGQSITVTLSDEVDISRGDLMTSVGSPPQVSDMLEVACVWMDETPCRPSSKYLLKLGTADVSGTVADIHHEVDVNHLALSDCNELSLNSIGLVRLELHRPIAVDCYQDSRVTGSLIFIDPTTNRTVGAGMVTSTLARNEKIPAPARVGG